MARRVSATHKLVTTVAAWIVGFAGVTAIEFSVGAVPELNTTSTQ